jgi:hypothetical protein
MASLSIELRKRQLTNAIADSERRDMHHRRNVPELEVAATVGLFCFFESAPKDPAARLFPAGKNATRQRSNCVVSPEDFLCFIHISNLGRSPQLADDD